MQSYAVKDYNTYARQGRFQEAAQCLQTALKDKPDDLETFYMLHLLEEKVLNSTLKNKIDRVTGDDSCTKMNLAYGNLLLSKFEQQAGNYEKELHYLLKGHDYFFQSKKEKFEAELKYWFDVLPRIEEIISLKKVGSMPTRGWMQAIRKPTRGASALVTEPDEPTDRIKPIFIVGVPRCGSTLIERVITSSTKRVLIGEETGIFNFLIHQGSREKILEAYRQKNLIRAASDCTFTDKSLENFFHIKFIKDIFPNAKIINCTRDVLASTMSILQTNLTEAAWAHDLKNISKYFDLYHQKIEGFKKIFPNFIYDLNYEKFINNPEAESKKLMEYCDLPWDRKCLEFYKKKDIVSDTPSNIQIRKAIYKHSLNKYLSYVPFILKHK